MGLSVRSFPLLPALHGALLLAVVLLDATLEAAKHPPDDRTTLETWLLDRLVRCDDIAGLVPAPRHPFITIATEPGPAADLREALIALETTIAAGGKALLTDVQTAHQAMLERFAEVEAHLGEIEAEERLVGRLRAARSQYLEAMQPVLQTPGKGLQSNLADLTERPTEILRATQLSFRTADLPPRAPETMPVIRLAYADPSPGRATADDLAPSDDAPFDPEIPALAEQLGHVPVWLQEYVLNEIRTE